ncbi:MAG: hypothetical protein SchgKO_03890 [Schleiferiaceae bacterium]
MKDWPNKVWNLEDWEFIEKHLKEDPVALQLKYGRDSEKNKALVSQVARWQKLHKKFPKIPFTKGWILPPELSIEQASSSETAAYKAHWMSNKNVVDVTGGMGMDAMEISQVSKSYTHIESVLEISLSAQSLLRDKALCICGDSSEILPQLETEYNVSKTDVLYADPARRDDKGNKVISWEMLTPNPLEQLPLWLQTAPEVWIRLTPMTDILEIEKSLTNVSVLHIMGKGREAKEITAVCKREPSPLKIQISTDSNPDHIWELAFSEVNQPPRKISSPKKYLYDPHSTVMISRAWNWICEEFDLFALDTKTRLFTSDQLITNFPGRVFEIHEIHPSLPKGLKGRKLAIATQNHPVKAADLKKKLKAKESDSEFLWATQSQGKYIYLLASKYR